MEKLLTNYSPTDIIMYTVILCLAVKGVVSFIDWACDRARKVYDKDHDEREEINSIKGDVSELKDAKADTKECIDRINESIAMLIESDKEDIKSYVTERHHHFVYEQGWIDDYSLECLERKFVIYRHEHGNSFVEGLMDEIRALPKQPPEQYKHKFDGTATYVKNAKAKTKH